MPPNPERNYTEVEKNREKAFSLKFAEGTKERREATKKILERVKKAEKIQQNKDKQRAIAYQVEAATVDTMNTGKVFGKEKTGDPTLLNETEHAVYKDTIATSLEDEDSGKEESARDITEIIFQSPVFQVHYPQWYTEYTTRIAMDEEFKQQYPTLNSYVLAKGKEFIQARQNDLTEARIKKLPLDPTLSLSETEKEQQRIVQAAVAFVSEHQADLVAYTSSGNKENQKQLYLDFIAGLGIEKIEDKEVKALFQSIAEDTVAAYTAQEKMEAAHEEMVSMLHNTEDNRISIDENEWDMMVQSAMLTDADDLLKEAFAGEIIYQFPYKTWNGKVVYYRIFRDKVDDKNLEIWKEDVDGLIDETHKELSLPYEQRSPEIQKAFGREFPSQKDLILYSISKFLLSKRTKKFDHLGVRAEIVSEKTQPLTVIGKNTDNCIKVSVMVRELAKMYGIQGEVVPESTGTGHVYWQEASDEEGKGSIVDTYWTKTTNGYVKHPEDWVEGVKDDLRAEGHDPIFSPLFIGRTLPDEE